MSSIRLQEIMTRAVVGRCDRRVFWTHTAPADGADCVLGVHVSHAQLSVEQGASGPEVRLTAVCEVWCGAGDGTRVERIACTHTEPADVPLVARVVGETETTGRLLRGARCLEAEVREGLFHLTIEMHIALETVGMARLWVKAFDLEEEGLADLDALGSGTSDSSQSAEEPAADWEQEAGEQPWGEPDGWGEPEEWTVAEPDGGPDVEGSAESDGHSVPEPPRAEPEADHGADPEAGTDGEDWGGFRTDMAAVASVQDRESRRTSAAVARFRGPTSARITIIQ